MKKIITLLSLVCSVSLWAGQVFYVVEGGAGNKDGSTWADAFSDVQDAIDAAASVATAESPSEVWIAKGTYKHGSAMTMKNGVAIYGGFAGTETSKEERIAGNNTILDGEGKYRVFYNNYTESNPLTNSAKLDNVTIQNGYISNYSYGAGMYNYYASPEITNCTFTNNSASSSGGGMYNTSSSSPVLTNCTFSGNSASSWGGGMYNSGSSTKPVLTNCTFSNNSGGGMHNRDSSSPTLTNCTFSGNSASSSGGGMYNSSSNPKLTNCTFSNNSASSSGGGMENHYSSPVLTNCTFTNNSAYEGGGMENYYSSPTLTNCILWGNTASSSGNEIYNEDYDSNSKPTIDTCIIKGGKEGIYNSDYCTFTTEPITADPKLMPLGNYGGNVQTCPVGAGSSAIGAGKVVEGLTTDARGFARSSTPTIGACEYQNKLTISTITITEGGLKYSSSYEFTLNANVSDADGSFTYQWYKDGVAISGATSSSYKTKQDAGTSKYIVVVSDGTTSITSSEITIETVDVSRYYVSTEGSSENDGLSWATAKSDLQEAIDLASSHNAYAMEVWIAKGTYKHGSAMTMKNCVAIYGGFAGTETSKDQRVSGNNTILDGEGKYRVFNNNYSSSNKLTNSAKLDNVTIQNGYASDGKDNSSSTADYGAGMYNEYASPEITNCTFSNNSASSSGGGMENHYSSPVLTNCTFSGNSARYFGGGMYNTLYSSSTLTNCTFANNSATYGGGMYNDSSDPELTNCILWGNTATSSGNEIYNDSNCKPTIDTCIIKGGVGDSYGTYTNIITADPKLMPLGNYGGSVQTCPVGAGSSAIGAGKVVEGLTTDARGFTRSSTSIIGACEFANKLTGVSITTSEGYLKYSSSYEFTLNALSEGTNLTYQWYKDGVAIEGATSSSYKTSQSVGTSKYTVVVSDGTTTITSSEIAIETINPVIYVSTEGSSSNDGLSWTTAKSDIQEVIDVASEYYGSEVWIAKGTYKHGSAMTMKNGVAIYGGFAGTETSKEERIAGNNTILDGEGKYRVFYNNYTESNPLTNSAKLDNVTIQNGYISNYSYGAGMYNYYASPKITNCTFTNNSASSRGGGMYNEDSSPVLTNCTFSNNSTDLDGGGMYNFGYYGTCNPVLTNCTFSNNSAYHGGGMYNTSSSSPVLTNCILWGNTASNSGNEIYNDSYSKPTIDTCIIKGGKDGISGSDYCTFTTEPITADPLLQALADNGGSVQTIAVAEGSSAIGAGKVIEDLTTDARGVARSTTAPTIGAYEYVKVQTAFESWAENTGLTGDNAKPTATPHNDGITNLEKFTFGLDASKATSYDANANFKHSTDASGNATLQFSVNVDAENVVQVKALKSVDLINWVETTATATGETSSDGKFKIYKATAPVGEEGKVFLKLQVEEK